MQQESYSKFADVRKTELQLVYWLVNFLFSLPVKCVRAFVSTHFVTLKIAQFKSSVQCVFVRAHVCNYAGFLGGRARILEQYVRGFQRPQLSF